MATQAPRPVRRDDRSPEAKLYRRWYGTALWQAIRKRQLDTHPLCAMCKAEGYIVAATVCDHVEPHRGDRTRFFAGPFQSLCVTHHDKHKQREERRGYAPDVGDDGWPTDPRHPANR